MTTITRVQIPKYPLSGEREDGSYHDENYSFANGVLKALKAAGNEITFPVAQWRTYKFDMNTGPDAVRGILTSHFNVPQGVDLRHRTLITEQKIAVPGEDNIGHLFVILPPS